MKYLRYIKESRNSLTQQDVEDMFALSFDLSTEYKIVRSNAINNLSEKELTKMGLKLGWNIKFHYNLKKLTTSKMEDFVKYANFLNEIKDDIHRLKEMYSINDEFLFIDFFPLDEIHYNHKYIVYGFSSF